MPYKISVFLPDLSAGGAEWLVLRLAKGLAAKGHAITFVVGCIEGALCDQVQSAFEVHALVRPQKQARGFLFWVRMLVALVGYMRSADQSMIVSPLPLPGMLAALAKRMARTSIKLLLIESDMPSVEGRKDGWLFHALRRMIKKFVYTQADSVTAFSRAVAEDMARFSHVNASKFSVIYNPVLPEGMDALKHAGMNHPWIIYKDKPVLLAVGRLHKSKGFDTLIKAMVLVRQDMDVRLIIIGEGEERDTLQAMIDERGLQDDIDLAGHQDNVYPFMAEADLFVLSSRHEAAGNALVEALACGLPVVATDCGAPSEILDGEEVGLLLPVGNAGLLAAGILAELRGEPRLYRPWFHATDFSVSTSVGAYDRLIQSVIG